MEAPTPHNSGPDKTKRALKTGVTIWTVGWILWAIHGVLLLVGLSALGVLLTVGVGGALPGTAIVAVVAYPGAVVSAGVAALLLGIGSLSMGMAIAPPRPREAEAPADASRRPWGAVAFLFGFGVLSIAALFGMMGAGRIGPRDQIIAAVTLVLLCWILSSLVFVLAAVAMIDLLRTLRQAAPEAPAINGLLPVVYGIVNVVGVVLFALTLLISIGGTVSPELPAAAALLALLVVPVLAVIGGVAMAIQGLRLRGALTTGAP